LSFSCPTAPLLPRLSSCPLLTLWFKICLWFDVFLSPFLFDVFSQGGLGFSSCLGIFRCRMSLSRVFPVQPHPDSLASPPVPLSFFLHHSPCPVGHTPSSIRSGVGLVHAHPVVSAPLQTRHPSAFHNPPPSLPCRNPCPYPLILGLFLVITKIIVLWGSACSPPPPTPLTGFEH